MLTFPEISLLNKTADHCLNIARIKLLAFQRFP